MLLKQLLVVIFAGFAVAIRSLIVYDAENISLDSPPEDLKQLVAFLKQNDTNVVLRGYTDDDLILFAGEENLFLNIVLLPAASKKISQKDELNKERLVHYSQKGGNLVIVGDSRYNYPDEIREYLNEIGIYPSPKGYNLTDHFTKSGKAQLASDNIQVKKVLSEIDTEYDGQSAIISNNPNLLPIVRASKTSFASNEKINPLDNDNSWGIGSQSYVIVGNQALNGARVTWVGSSQLLSEELLTWSLGQRNVLKLQFTLHHKADDPANLDNTLYRVKDQVIYSVGVSELVGDKWVPYVVKDDEDTLQLSFKMLDPYQRLNLEPLGEVQSVEDGPLDTYLYFANFTVPDQHGMFTFELDYKRQGLTYLLDKKVVAVRHLANDEFKRSWEITNSWFYVASALFVVIGWVLFVVNFLYVTKVDLTKKNA